MKKVFGVIFLVLSLVGVLAIPAMASANGGIPPHGHMLVLGVEFGPTGPTYKKCVDLANNQAVPLHAHHEHLHFGSTGEKLRTNAGHFVVPTAPFSDIIDCAHLEQFIGPPTR